jgi:hypothetical protein
MYGNTPFGDETASLELTADQRKAIRRDLSTVAARTRELLPSEFVVGSEITQGTSGPRATVAVQPPVGSVVSADYTIEDDITIEEAEREDLAMGLAASAALQMKQAMPDDPSPTAQ